MLFRNLLRILKSRFIQFLVLGLIISLSSFSYALMYYATQGIDAPTRQFLEDSKIEHFSMEQVDYLTSSEEYFVDHNGHTLPTNFNSLVQLKNDDPTLYEVLMNRREEAFNNLYPTYELEIQYFKNFYFDIDSGQNRAFLIKDTTLINLPFMEEGEKPLFDSEVAVTRKWAEAHSLHLGDSLELSGHIFTISGFVLFPDYTFPVLDRSLIVDLSKQTLMLMNDSSYEEFPGVESFRYAGREIDGTFNETTFQNEVIDTYKTHDEISFVLQVVPSSKIMRSGAIYEELNQGTAVTVLFSVMLALIAMAFVAMVLLKIVQSQRRQIGVLKALGYSRFRILLPYIGLIILLALPSLLFGYGIGYMYAEPMKELYLDFYLIPVVPITPSNLAFINAIIIPLVVFTFTSCLAVFLMLSGRTIDMLYRGTRQKSSWLSRLAVRQTQKLKAKTSFTINYALQNSSKFVMFFIGMMLSTILLTFTFSFSGVVDRFTTDYYLKVDYQYEAYIDQNAPLPAVEVGQEKILKIPYAAVEDETTMLVGLSPNQTLYRLIDEKNNDISSLIDEGLVISAFVQAKHQFRIGQMLEINVLGRLFEYPLVGITDEYMAARMYLPIEEVSLALSRGIIDSLFNGIYSIEHPDVNLFPIVISKASILEQAEVMKDFMDQMIFILVGSAAVLSMLIIGLLSQLTLEENIYSISLLRVLGYQQKEISSMVLNSYLIYLGISYWISVPLAYGLLRLLINFIAVQYDLVMPLDIAWWHMLLGFAFSYVFYLAGTFFTRIKINKISLQETLKVYSE